MQRDSVVIYADIELVMWYMQYVDAVMGEIDESYSVADRREITFDI